MTLQEKIELLAEVLDVEEDEIEPDANLAEVEEWDSLSKLGLMAEVKVRMGKKLTVEEIQKFQTIGDILEYLQ